MKTRALVFVLLALGAAALAYLPGEDARAEEEYRNGVWRYDVRIVRVDPATLEGVETLSLFEEAEGTTVPMGWQQILGILKQRGPTTILVDQRVTSLDGERAVVSTLCETPLVAVNFKDDNNTQLRASVHQTGCKCELTSHPAGMRYEVEAKWGLPRYPSKSTEAPPHLSTSWKGSHPPLDGEALVLRYREQIDAFGLPAPKPVELYAVITARFIAK